MPVMVFTPLNLLGHAKSRRRLDIWVRILYSKSNSSCRIQLRPIDDAELITEHDLSAYRRLLWLSRVMVTINAKPLAVGLTSIPPFLCSLSNFSDVFYGYRKQAGNRPWDNRKLHSPHFFTLPLKPMYLTPPAANLSVISTNRRESEHYQMIMLG